MKLKDYPHKLAHAAAAIKMPGRIFRDLCTEWDAECRERGEEPFDEVSFEYESHVNRQGIVFIVLEPEKDGIKIIVKAADIPDLANDEPEDDLEVGEDIDLTNAKTIDPLKQPEIWDELNPVTQMKAERRIGPNEPCPCGSGKKAKKCCG